MRWIAHGAFVFGLASAACGASAVPNIESSYLRSPALPGVLPRTVSLKVVDARAPRPEESEATVQSVRDALRGTLERAHIAESRESPNKLTLRMVKAEAAPGFEDGDCVRTQLRLDVGTRGFAEATADGCFEWRHLFGFSLGGDPTKAYTTSLNLAVEGLDRELRRLFGPG